MSFDLIHPFSFLTNIYLVNISSIRDLQLPDQSVPL